MGELKSPFQYLREAYKRAGEVLFTRVCSDGTSGNGFNLNEGRFRLAVRKKLNDLSGCFQPKPLYGPMLIMCSLNPWRTFIFTVQSDPLISKGILKENIIEKKEGQASMLVHNRRAGSKRRV